MFGVLSKADDVREELNPSRAIRNARRAIFCFGGILMPLKVEKCVVGRLCGLGLVVAGPEGWPLAAVPWAGRSPALDLYTGALWNSRFCRYVNRGL